MAYTYSDILEAACNNENTPGVNQQLLYAPKADISVWPGLPAAPATDGELVTIATGFTMEALKVFHKLDAIVDSIEIKSELQGVLGSKSYKHTMELKLAGNSDAVEAFIRKVKNCGYAFVATEKDGTIRLFGSENDPALLESESKTSGKTATDESAVTLVFTSNGKGHVPKFTGNAPLV